MVGGFVTGSLWLETSLDGSIQGDQDSDGASVTSWGNQASSSTKTSIVAVGTGPTYANTINGVHAVKFVGSTANYLQISDASLLNNTDYTIFILEKRQGNNSNNYFLGENPSASANQTLVLGYNADSTVIHSQGTGNSYSSNISSYADSTEKARQFTFTHSATDGNKTYINGLLAAQDPTKTSHLNNISTLAIGKGYTGEIGEIAIFAKVLNKEARTSVEDYIATKWGRKNNRKTVADASCTSGIVTDTGCSTSCSTSSIYGVTSPTTVADGQSGVTATCGQNGYSGTITVGCSGGGITRSGNCACDSNYVDSSGTCVPEVSCAFNSVTGVTNGTSVSSTSGTQPCNAANFNDSIGYTCNTSNGTLTISPGDTCDVCASGYIYSSGSCIASFSCAGGNTTGTYGIAPNIRKYHIFNSNGSLICSAGTSNSVNALLVGGGGGGGAGSSTNGGGAGGGGGGQVVSSLNNTLTSSTSFTLNIVVVGTGGAGGATNSAIGTRGISSTVSGLLNLTATGGNGGGGRNNTNTAIANGPGGGQGQANTAGSNGGINAGGPSFCCTNSAGGGGGSTAQAGTGNGSSASTAGGTGGAGTSVNLTGSSISYGGGGGGGGGGSTSGVSAAGVAGSGCNGNGAKVGTAATAVAANLGCGGGGGTYQTAPGANGGSGIVIINYPAP